MNVFTCQYIYSDGVYPMEKKALTHSCCHLAVRTFALTVIFFLTDMLITQFRALSIVLSSESNMVLLGGMFLALSISLIKPLFVYSYDG